MFLFFFGVFFFSGGLELFPYGPDWKVWASLSCFSWTLSAKVKTHRKDAIVWECVRMSSSWRPASVLFSDTN